MVHYAINGHGCDIVLNRAIIDDIFQPYNFAVLSYDNSPKSCNFFLHRVCKAGLHLNSSV